jgi:hypothetical protein
VLSTYTTPGIGMVTLPNSNPGLGVVPVAEGQIDTTNMPLGTYILKLVPPASGINVLRGDVNLYANRDAFATPVDVPPTATTIRFIVREPIPPDPPHLVSAASRRWHNSVPYDLNLPIALASTASEPRKNGLELLILTFDKPVQATDGVLDTTIHPDTSGEVVLKGGGADGYAELSPDGTAMEIWLLPGPAAGTCFSVTVQGLEDTAEHVALAGDNDVHVRILQGDVNSSGTITAGDMGLTKMQLGATITAENAKYDINYNGQFSIDDLDLIKNDLGASVSCP